MPASVTSSKLTAEGYSRVGNSSIYARTFGPIMTGVMVSVTLPAEGGSPGLRIDARGDIAAADAAAVAASLARLGFRDFAAWPSYSGWVS